MAKLILTIDGPAGTGKSTVSRLVAARLGMPHLDTGAFYRAATLVAMRSGVDLSDADAVIKTVEKSELEQRGGAMYVGAENVSVEIRDPSVSANVSVVSAHPGVRSALVGYQRDWVDRHGGSAVVEGRDIGSVVFPDADLKIYLDATPEIRARRRAQDTGQDHHQVLDEQARRDAIDSSRPTSPLTVPTGAHVIDTTTLTVSEVVDSIGDLAESASN